jgi:hypothetical protein
VRCKCDDGLLGRPLCLLTSALIRQNVPKPVVQHRILIEFSLTPSGAYSVAADLDGAGVRWPWLLRELRRLSDEDILALFTEDAGGRAGGTEGRWGLLDLDPYWLISYLKMSDSNTWRVGTGKGLLTISRLYRRTGADAAIAEMRRLEDESERRRREEGED